MLALHRHSFNMAAAPMSERSAEPSLLSFQERVTGEVEDFRRRMWISFGFSLVLCIGIAAALSLFIFGRYHRAEADVAKVQNAALSVEESRVRAEKTLADLESMAARASSQYSELGKDFSVFTNQLYKEVEARVDKTVWTSAGSTLSGVAEDIRQIARNLRTPNRTAVSAEASAELDQLAAALEQKDLEAAQRSAARLRELLKGSGKMQSK